MLPNRTARSMAFWLIATFAIGLQTGLAIITTWLATTTLSTTHISNLALAAAALDICAVAVLAIRLGLCFYRASNSRLAWYHCLSIAIALAGSGTTIYVLVWSLDHVHTLRNTTIAGGAVWAVAFVCQAGFYVTLLWPSSPLPGGHGQADETMMNGDSPRPSVKRSLSVQMSSLTPSKQQREVSATPSPKDSGFAPSPRSTIRDSIHQAVRPMTSKTRLLISKSSFVSTVAPSVATRPASFETARHDHGFEDWDTSSVEDNEAMPTARRPPTRSRLETIPGSRPVSPAKPLDGPFPGPIHDEEDELEPERIALPESPTPSPLASPLSESGSFAAFPLSIPRRPSVAAGSIGVCASANSSQSHIHPLFRPESPLPPPLASPGTVITASPYAGQIVNSSDVTLSSRLRSTSTLVPTYSRPSSANAPNPHPFGMPMVKGIDSKTGSLRSTRSMRLHSASGTGPFAYAHHHSILRKASADFV